MDEPRMMMPPSIGRSLELPTLDRSAAELSKVGDKLAAVRTRGAMLEEGLNPAGLVVAAVYRPHDDMPGDRYQQLMSERQRIFRDHDDDLPTLVARWKDIDDELDSMLIDSVATHNLITQVGDQYYGERAAGIGGAPSQVSGMRLGTGSTAVAKTGAGAAIVTYVTGSAVAIDGSFPTSALSGSSRRIQFKTTWNAGTATASGLAEVVITNEASLTDVAGTSANTISRALLSPTINKGASDTLAVTWSHDLLGA